MKIDILGVKIDNLNYFDTLKKIELIIDSNLKEYIVTANPEILLEALNNLKYLNILNKAKLVTADCIGIIWAAKFLSLKSKSYFKSIIQIIYTGILLLIYPKYFAKFIPERITGIDLMDKLCKFSEKKKYNIYLLGGEAGIAQKTKVELLIKYPNLSIVGYEIGPDEKTVENINRVRANILFVAFGAPKQELWIDQNLNNLNINLAIGVGGAFDFVSGQVKRAPRIYQDLNLEWFYRLIKEPWRAIRIFNATFKFIYYLTKFKHQFN